MVIVGRERLEITTKSSIRRKKEEKSLTKKNFGDIYRVRMKQWNKQFNYSESPSINDRRVSGGAV